MKPLMLVALMALAASAGADGPQPGAGAEDELYFSCDVLESAKPSPLQGSLWVWSPKAGTLRRFAPDYRVYGFCFSPDGNRLAFLGARAPDKEPNLDLYVLDLRTDQVHRHTTGFWGSPGCVPAWRPGMEQVAAARIYNRSWEALASHLQYGGDTLWLLDLGTGKRVPLIGPGTDIPVSDTPQFSADGSTLACTRHGLPAAVLEVSDPTRWLRLDRPERMNPKHLLDWIWQGRSQVLLIGATAARRPTEDRSLPPGAWPPGPGGVWRWDTAHPRVYGNPRPHDWDPDPGEGDRTAAEPLFGQGESVYVLALSPDETRLAYLTDSGLWVRDLKGATSVQLVARSAIAELLKSPGGQDEDLGLEYGLPAWLSWSPGGTYLALSGWRSGTRGSEFRVIEMATARTIALPPLGPGFAPDNTSVGCAAWRPMPRSESGAVKAP